MARVLIGNFKGPKGDKGDTGATGATGAQGPQGKQGNTGATGATGPQGIQGVKGDPGPQGPKGDKGDTGATGATGQRGSRWTAGTAITGTSTTAGIFSGTGIADALVNDMYLNTSNGNTYRCTTPGSANAARWVYTGNIRGATGPQGPKGATGATGATGPQGIQGVKGDPGPQGPKGDKGNTGATGPTGQRGSRWTAGTVITGTSTTETVFSGTGIADALVNDMYLNTSNGNTYRCTTPGSANAARWVYTGNIRGATGPKGDKGDTGATGATGPQGPKGDKGATGPQGPKGDKGATGATGATGPQGPQGEKGPQGPQGKQGNTGATGATGPQGPQGKQGNTGPTGQRGSRWTEGTAITGTSTTAGIFSGTGIADALVNDMYLNTSTGNVYRCTVGGASSVAKWAFVGCIKGATGATGPKGATGATGPKGDKGATGPQGPQGEKGATGPQGPQGEKGAQGPRGATGATGTADTTFTEASTLTKLTSGEPFKTMLGKLAKAVSSVFDKLDKSNVVNNQTTTVGGFALDARQANPNVEGSLGAKIKAVNETVNTLKKSVSDGKTKVANAITDKGVETATDATFDVMAENISKINTEFHGATLAVSTEESTLFGKTVALTFNGANVDTTVFASNGKCSFVVQNPGTYTITCGEANDEVTVTGDNVVNKTVISVELSLFKIVAFATGTDKEIANMIKAHYNNKINIADYWAVGDMRTVHLSAMAATGVGESHRAQDVQFVIGDFDHDDLATPINGHTKAAATLLQKGCLMDSSNASNPINGNSNTENGYMNRTDTNVGGWKNCDRRTWCNNVYFGALPSVWQSMVKTVNKKVSVGNASSTIETVQDKIFLAAEVEIFGSSNFSFAGEGTQYQYYKNATANRYKMPKWYPNNVSNRYWGRSPLRNSTQVFCYVLNDGSTDGDYANKRYGVATCLCI